MCGNTQHISATTLQCVEYSAYLSNNTAMCGSHSTNQLTIKKTLKGILINLKTKINKSDKLENQK